jgi:hypothetical protein
MIWPFHRRLHLEHVADVISVTMRNSRHTFNEGAMGRLLEGAYAKLWLWNTLPPKFARQAVCTWLGGQLRSELKEYHGTERAAEEARKA